MFRHKPGNARDKDERCGIHQFDGAAGRCRTCGDAYCGDCLIFPHGARRPPYCVRCALVAAGVRRPARARLNPG
jgi:hypothetical protein